jgi:hypothetical protein
MTEGQFVGVVAATVWTAWIIWVVVRSLSKHTPKPSDIQYGKLNAANPILIFYSANHISKRDMVMVHDWLHHKGIESCTVPLWDTPHILSICDLTNMPVSDMDEIRRLIAEKVTVSA